MKPLIGAEMHVVNVGVASFATAIAKSKTSWTMFAPGVAQ